MKYFYQSFIFIIVLFCGVFIINFQKQINAPSLLIFNGEEEEGIEKKNWITTMLADPLTGKIPNSIRQKELLFANNFSSNNQQRTTAQEPWKQRGIWNVGGRTRAFAVDVTNENILFAGGVSGGLWRSVNAGLNWSRVTDKVGNPDVTAITQDKRKGHEQTWYYTSGECTGTSASGGSSFYLGDGIYKSTDGGNTWSSLISTMIGNPQSFSQPYQLIWNVALNQANKTQDEILIASVYYGIHRSIDGGNTFTQVLGTANNCGYEADILIDTNGVYYATSSSSGAIKGIFRSIDGTNWINITPTNFPSTYGRVKIGINPSNQNELYFLAAETDTFGLLTYNYRNQKQYNSLWKYTYINGNGTGSGGSWIDLSKNLPHGNGGFDDWNTQTGYDLVIKVHPTQPNTVFIGGTNIYRSTDGFTSNNNTQQIGGYKIGTTLPHFEVFPNHHPDQHDIAFSKSNPNILYNACDGGVFRLDSCLSKNINWISLNNGYLTTQFYTVQLHPNYTSDIIIGGLQDNGNYWNNSAQTNASWKMTFNGDGSYSDISNDGNTYYLSIQQGKMIKANLDNNGNITKYARIDPSFAKRDDYQFINPFVLDKADDKIMYLPAGRKLYRNNDLSAIPFSNNNDSISTNWIQFPDTLTGTSEFTAISCSKQSHTLFLGTNARKVYKIINANTGNPKMIDITGAFPSGYVSCIAIDPTDDNKIVVAFSNYNIYSIFYSTDGGSNWERVAGNLEQFYNGIGNGPSIRWISILPYNGKVKYFAGTSIGLFSADTLAMQDITEPGTQWMLEAPNEIGNTIVPNIYVRESDQMIAVATHGSGVFTTHYGWQTGIGNVGANHDINISPNPTKNKLNINWSSNSNHLIEINLFSIDGKHLQNKKNILSSKGMNTETLDLSDISSGIYLVCISNGKEQYIKKIIKQ